jgi:hypothetical protein
MDELKKENDNELNRENDRLNREAELNREKELKADAEAGVNYAHPAAIKAANAALKTIADHQAVASAKPFPPPLQRRPTDLPNPATTPQPSLVKDETHNATIKGATKPAAPLAPANVRRSA